MLYILYANLLKNKQIMALMCNAMVIVQIWVLHIKVCEESWEENRSFYSILFLLIRLEGIR